MMAAAAASFSAKGQSGSAEIAEHDIVCASLGSGWFTKKYSSALQQQQ
jgi:hypothetical protein